MIDKGYFAGAFINEVDGRIIFLDEAGRERTELDCMMEENGQNIVKCLNCGGRNVIGIGQNCECDYCGSLIKIN